MIEAGDGDQYWGGINGPSNRQHGGQSSLMGETVISVCCLWIWIYVSWGQGAAVEEVTGFWLALL